MKKLCCLFLIASFFLACQGQKEKNSVNTPEMGIANGEVIPFDYDEKMLKLIIFEGLINDSITMRVMYDTGVPSDTIIMSEKWKEDLGTSVHLQIGSIAETIGIAYKSKDLPMYEQLGHDLAIIGNPFFKGRIIEISFEDKHIRIVEDMEDLEGYTQLETKELNGFYFIPVRVFIGDKTIDESAIVDTGYNGYINFDYYTGEKYGIQPDETVYHGGSLTSQGITDSFSMAADSIQIADFSIPDIRAAFLKSQSARGSALLGTGVLEHFSVVLDLKDKQFYIKPNSPSLTSKDSLLLYQQICLNKTARRDSSGFHLN